MRHALPAFVALVASLALAPRIVRADDDAGIDATVSPDAFTFPVDAFTPRDVGFDGGPDYTAAGGCHCVVVDARIHRGITSVIATAALVALAWSRRRRGRLAR